MVRGQPLGVFILGLLDGVSSLLDNSMAMVYGGHYHLYLPFFLYPSVEVLNLR